MALGRAIRAGAAYIELTVNDSKLVKGLKAAQNRLQSFGSSLRGIGGMLGGLGVAAGGALLPMIKVAADAEEGLNKFLAVFGDQGPAAGKFAEDLAKRVGRSAIDIRNSMSSFQGMFVGLEFDSGTARQMSETLQALSIDFASFNNLSDEEASDRFISALSGSSEVLDKFGINIRAAALDQQFLEMGLKTTTAKATEQQKVMARLAIIMKAMGDQDSIGDAEKTQGSLANQTKRLQANLKDTAATIGKALVPVIAPLVSKLSEVVNKISEWAKANPELFATILKVVGGVAIAGVLIIGLGIAASALAAIFGVLAGIMTAVATGIGLLISLVGAILSPIGLVIAAVVALGGYLLATSGTGGSALDWLRQKFGSLMDDALMVFGAIRDALSSGDFETAAKILWLGLRLAWVRGVAFLRQKWAAFKNAFLKIATEAWFGAAILLNNAWAGLEKAWAHTTAFFSNTWSKFVGFVLKSWNNISAAIRKAWAKVKSVVSGTDASAEIQRIENETTAQNNRIANETSSAVSAREDERKRRLAQIERDREGTNTELVKRADAINAGRKADEDKAIADAAADVQRARDELAASIKQVNPAKTSADEADGPAPPPDLKTAMDAIAKGGAAAGKKLEANSGVLLGTDEGTKALLEAFRGTGKDPADDTAKNTKKMAGDLAKLKTEAKETNTLLNKAIVAKVEKA